MEDASVSRKDQARTLDFLQARVKINNTEIKIDPLILFCRVTSLLEREEDGRQVENIRYELTPEPNSLFKDGMMRKPTKSSLRNHIIKKNYRAVKPHGNICVVGGGTVLHKAPWTLQSTYSEFADSFITYLNSKCGHNDCIHVVFDGYTDMFSLKCTEHSKRGQITISSNVSVGAEMKVTTKRESFLRNKNNKIQFIQFLCQKSEFNCYPTK